jgi:predicted ArsR family transcriptional regulator
VARLVGLLEEFGFAPEAPEGGAAEGMRIGLRNCPFLDLAEARPEVVCPVHLGLMRGALEGWGAPVTVDRLEPFAEPDRCLAHVSGHVSGQVSGHGSGYGVGRGVEGVE